MNLSIIIVNYNGKEFLKDCFHSIFENCKNIDYEIIIVDNDSKDGSSEYIRQNYNEKVYLIESKENLGFAKGNNLGVKHAKYDNILLLNNDTILVTSLNTVLKYFENNLSVGLLGLKMLGKDSEFRLSVGYFPSPIRLLQLAKLYLPKDKLINSHKPVNVDWIEGSFLLTRKTLWKKTSGLDESYFMYVEDMDYCKQIQLLDKKRVFYPNASYIHFGGYNAGREKMLKTGFKKYLNKFHSGLYKYLCFLALELNFTFKYVKKSFRKNS